MASALFCAFPAYSQTTAFKTGEAVTGMTKQCYYNALGNQYTQTVSSVALCPLSITVQTTLSGSQMNTPKSGGMAFKSGEKVTGLTKQCYYQYLGNQYSRTISAVALCPLSIPVN